ncbi:MAG: DNA primase [Gammaproteobacteria bacterium]
MAGRIPEQFIDALLARVDIVDVIEAHLPLRRAGRDFQALCPFHGEKTPSFTISREKQFYHCFGCGAHGSAIGFLMKYRNLEFPEAIEELAGLAGMEVPQEARSQRPSNNRELYDVLEQARAFYEAQLRQSGERDVAVNYLKKRGLSGEVAKAFRLGFAPSGWRNLIDALTARGLSETQLERAGLAIKRDRGGYYDRFRERVMFPIHDRRGRVIGFGGRVIESGEPKYLNSPETEVFHKGRELYGLHEALAADRKLARLVVVEGYLDVVALHQFGLPQAVATLGTAVTREHLELLFRQVPEVVFCFDGDAAGKRAAWRALEIALPLQEGNRAVRFAFLPDGHDPDSAVREYGAEGFFKAARVFGLTDYLLDTLKQDVDLSTGDGRARLVEQAKPYLLQIPSQSHRATAVRGLVDLSKFDDELIRRELGLAGARSAGPRRPPILNRFKSRTLEEQALAMLLQNPPLVAHISPELAAFCAAELGQDLPLLEVRRALEAGAPPSTAALLERWRDHPLEGLLSQLAATDLGIPDSAFESEFVGALKRLAARAEEQRFARISAIPFEQWSEEQREIVRNYKRPR